MTAQEHPLDVCECGDYRHQHKNGKGRCLLGDLCTPTPCQKFRFFRGPSENEITYGPGRRVPHHGSGPDGVSK